MSHIWAAVVTLPFMLPIAGYLRVTQLGWNARRAAMLKRMTEPSEGVE